MIPRRATLDIRRHYQGRLISERARNHRAKSHVYYGKGLGVSVNSTLPWNWHSAVTSSVCSICRRTQLNIVLFRGLPQRDKRDMHCRVPRLSVNRLPDVDFQSISNRTRYNSAADISLILTVRSRVLRQLFALALCSSASSSRLAAQTFPTRSSVSLPVPARTLPQSRDSISHAVSTSLTLVGDETVDRLRSFQLVNGVRFGESLLLRSPSSLTPPHLNSASHWRAALVSPQFLLVSNSALPFSLNNGALWAGKGLSNRTLMGFKFESARARIIVAPEIILSANSNWPLFHDFYVPAVPPGRSPYDLPYYAGKFTIDVPMRFGNRPIRRIDLGQTTALVSLNRLDVGFSNENEWWGPGVRNAIVLSNNAPGFPHLFLRTSHPIDTRFGAFEMRWLVGGLTESAYFDTISTNNTRSLSALAATLQTAWDPNLSVGFARSVYGTATGWGEIPWRWLDVFARTHRDVPDTTRTQRDQLFSLFARWVFPADGVEIYGEWGRTELRPNLRDFLIAPNHTQAYTIGLQWRGGDWHGGAFRLQSEITQLEQSATYRDGPLGSWYTSTRVIQGYTNRGEVLGASIGPGSSSQWLAWDYLRPAWRIGVFGGRIRWNQDVHNHSNFPVYVGYCNLDVSLYPGVRGAKSGALGTISAELSFQNRLTPFFQNGGGCPNNGRRLDIRNNTLSVTFAPFAR